MSWTVVRSKASKKKNKHNNTVGYLEKGLSKYGNFSSVDEAKRNLLFNIKCGMPLWEMTRYERALYNHVLSKTEFDD